MKQPKQTMIEEHAINQDANISETASPSPVSQQISPPPAPQPATAQQLEDVEKRMSAFEGSTLRLARWGLLITFLTGVFIALQLREIRRNSVDTHELAVQTKAQAEQAGKQVVGITELATQTKRSADIAIDAERPWIGLQNFEPRNFVLGGGGVMILTVINAGKSPADISVLEVAMRKYKQFPNNPDYGTPMSRPSRSFLVPGVTEGITNTIAMPKEEIAELMAKKTTLYIYGRVEYRDVRTNNRYTTHICQMYIPERSGFFICPSYNDAN